MDTIIVDKYGNRIDGLFREQNGALKVNNLDKLRNYNLQKSLLDRISKNENDIQTLHQKIDNLIDILTRGQNGSTNH
jgi:hypothetical protein